jgi:SAM-dependent methyltransferase
LDDTTLGWVYQYWNDPEREALDAKLNGGGKVEQHEIASKTQMFTERYMVEWMLHNSLGQMWLGMCKKNNWVAEVEADGTLQRLAERREMWQGKREVGEVALDALMPIESEVEERWKYWVPQPLTDSLVDNAPKSIKNLKILDPACGSGHFLVIAIALLFALYQEEAGHRGEDWSDKEIVESILENNLYGIDIDSRAVQIAAAALILKARLLCSQAQPKYLNLVASNL